MKWSYFLAFLSVSSKTIESVLENYKFNALSIENDTIVEGSYLLKLDTFVDYITVENHSAYCLWFGLDNFTLHYFCHEQCNEISFKHYVQNNVATKLYTFGPQHCPLLGKISSSNIMRAGIKDGGQYE